MVVMDMMVMMVMILTCETAGHDCSGAFEAGSYRIKCTPVEKAKHMAVAREQERRKRDSRECGSLK